MPNSERPIGWGVIGFGWVARDFMAPAIAEAGDRLVAVCDPNPPAHEAAARFGARAERDLASFLADPAVEAVYVATPNHLHRAGVEAAASAGKAVLCEKPMAATLADAEAIAAAVRRTGVLYGTAFDQRHHPAHAVLRDAIRDGLVGTVSAVRIVYACWLDRGWTACAGQDNWRIDAARAGGGAVMDLAPHGIDLIDFLLEEPLETVTALTQRRVQDYAVDDGGMLIGRTGSGVLASLHASYNCPEALPRRRLEILGSRGQLVALDTMGQTAGGSVSLIDGATGASSPIPFGDASPFGRQVRAFGDALRSGGRDAFSAPRDLHTMRLLAGAYGMAAAVPRGAALASTP